MPRPGRKGKNPGQHVTVFENCPSLWIPLGLGSPANLTMATEGEAIARLFHYSLAQLRDTEMALGAAR